MNYEIITTKSFIKSFDKLAKRNNSLANKIIDTLEQMGIDPFYQGLRTHKVQSKNYGIAYSSRVTGDIRIIWDFKKGSPVILALTVGSHTRKISVY